MEEKMVKRWMHSAEFRAEVLQACRQEGASVAAVALRSGVNANLVHRWRRLEGRKGDAGAGNYVAVAAGVGAGANLLSFGRFQNVDGIGAVLGWFQR